MFCVVNMNAFIKLYKIIILDNILQKLHFTIIIII